jgi:hypothetical protein
MQCSLKVVDMFEKFLEQDIGCKWLQLFAELVWTAGTPLLQGQQLITVAARYKA